jgi:hypothetical protein
MGSKQQAHQFPSTKAFAIEPNHLCFNVLKMPGSLVAS